MKFGEDLIFLKALFVWLLLQFLLCDIWRGGWGNNKREGRKEGKKEGNELFSSAGYAAG